MSPALKLPQISMIAGASNKGRVFFTINQGKNNTTTFNYFIVKLCSHLDTSGDEWRSKALFLMENASIHRSREALKVYEALGLNVMFLAPYSFQMAAVERLFSFIKNRDLNPLCVRKYSK